MLFRKSNYWLAILVAGLMATSSQLNADMFVSAAGANSVERYDCDTGQFLGNFVAPGSGGLGDAQGIAFGSDGNLYVSSNASNNVLRFDGETGDFIDVFATVSGTTFPAEINFRGDYLYLSNFAFGNSGRVSRFDALTGNFVDHFVTGASGADGTAWDSNGDLYVSAFGTNSVKKYDGDTGNFIEDFVTPGLGGLASPLDNLFLPDGTFLVSSFSNRTVKHYDANGNFLGDAITGLNGGPQGLEIGPDGFLYAGDFGLGQINRYDINTFELVGNFIDSNSTTNNFTFRPAAVPEPNCIGICIAGFLWISRRRKRSALG